MVRVERSYWPPLLAFTLHSLFVNIFNDSQGAHLFCINRIHQMTKLGTQTQQELDVRRGLKSKAKTG